MSDTKAWVGCLACYNGGRLVGEWVDGIEAGELTTEDLHANAIKDGDLGGFKVRADMAPHEELWVMDFEGYDGLLDHECSPVEAQRVAEAIDAIGSEYYPVEAVAAWLNWTGEQLEEWDAPTRDQFEEAYLGEWGSEEEWAEDLAEQTGMVASDGSREGIALYVDWERFARDLMMDGYYSAEAPGYKVFIFTSV